MFYFIFIFLFISLIFVHLSATRNSNNKKNNQKEKEQGKEKEIGKEKGDNLLSSFTIEKVNLDYSNHNKQHSTKSLHAISSFLFTCSNAAHGRQIAEKFLLLEHDKSNCPDEEGWFLAMAQNDPHSEKFFVNIGVNKGYNVAVWMNVFFPFLFITPPQWNEQLKKLRPLLHRASCGVCFDCKQIFTHPTEKLPYVSIASSFSHVDMLYADMNCDNIHLVHDILQRIRNNATNLGQYASFSGVCAGLSNQHSSITIPKCPESYERCSLDTTIAAEVGLKENITIPIITVDSLITKHLQNKVAHSSGHNSNHHVTVESTFVESQIQYLNSISSNKPYHPIVDLLLIDTEGHDYLVIQGAKQLIQSRSVRMIIFEYHYIPPWNETKLENVQKEFDDYGYDCYFEGQNRLWKITGEDCWDAAYEFHDWSNVLCVRREDVWYEVIQPFVVKE